MRLPRFKPARPLALRHRRRAPIVQRWVFKVLRAGIAPRSVLRAQPTLSIAPHLGKGPRPATFLVLGEPALVRLLEQAAPPSGFKVLRLGLAPVRPEHRAPRLALRPRRSVTRALQPEIKRIPAPPTVSLSATSVPQTARTVRRSATAQSLRVSAQWRLARAVRQRSTIRLLLAQARTLTPLQA